jgi:hypothetical protein
MIARAPGFLADPLNSGRMPLYYPLSPSSWTRSIVLDSNRLPDFVGIRTKGGSSSGVERHVANVVVVGSNPISRSIFSPNRLAAYARTPSAA